MSDVLISLFPAVLASVVFYGFEVLGVILTSILSAVIVESFLVGRKLRVVSVYGDGSAAVTGLLLALTLPPGFPLHFTALGSAAAITVGKLIFGGLGANIFNPALVGRALLLALWPMEMTSWRAPAGAVTSATPLAGGEASYFQLLVGMVIGSLGEISALLVVAGGGYLYYRGHIGWRIPVTYMGTAALLTLILGGDVLLGLLGGGLILGAVYMATDMVTSPFSKRGKLVFGFGCGLFTIIIRRYAALPEGVTYAILLMNAFVPLIDRYLKRPAFGET